MTKPNNPPAFPDRSYQDTFGDLHPGQHGMSLLDWFAGQALVGSTSSQLMGSDYFPTLAQQCYDIAEAMLRERERRLRDE